MTLDRLSLAILVGTHSDPEGTCSGHGQLLLLAMPSRGQLLWELILPVALGYQSQSGSY